MTKKTTSGHSAPVDRVKLIIEKLSPLYSVPKRKKSGDLVGRLIAHILSQATNDKNRDNAFQALKKRYRSWDLLLDAPEAQIVHTVRSAGLARQRAEKIVNCLRGISDRFNGLSLRPLAKWDDAGIMEFLTSFKGVGKKTAAVFLCMDLGRDICAVDTHVNRVCARTGLVDGKPSPHVTFERLKKLIPVGKAYRFHMLLIEHGRAKCRSRKPLCESCPLEDICLHRLPKKT